MRWDLIKMVLPEALATAGALREPDDVAPAVYWKGRAAEFRPDVFALVEVLNMPSPWPDQRPSVGRVPESRQKAF